MPRGFRLYRRVRIAPGVRLNLTRRGPSVSLGPRGAHLTVGHGRGRATVGVPGTGLYYSAWSGGRRRGRRAAAVANRAAPAAATTPARPPLLPGQKIALGVVLTCLVVLAPIGIPLIVVGLVQRSKPVWRARTLMTKAVRSSDENEVRRLLSLACLAAPEYGEAHEALADFEHQHGHWQDAASAYACCVALDTGGWLARAQFGHALLMSGRTDEAITQLTAVRASGAFTDEAAATVTANLATAFLAKGDAAQALELVRAEPLQRRTLGAGLKQCLYIRAVAQYQLGHRARAVQDVDRLWALSPGITELTQEKAAMESGTFTFDLGASPAEPPPGSPAAPPPPPPPPPPVSS